MTTTKVRGTEVCVTLTNKLTTNAVQSYTFSTEYVNTALKASVINILYHRLDIDKSEFITKQYNKIPYKIFRAKSKHPLVRTFHGYFAGFKDALFKKYLKELYMYFIDPETNRIVENYKFSFKYADNEENVEPQDGKILIETTSNLLQTLQNLSNHDKMDSDVKVKVELAYHKDTPLEYEPTGFQPPTDENKSLMADISKKETSVSLGTLFTGYHMLKCRGKGRIFDLNGSRAASVIDLTAEKNKSGLVNSNSNSENVISNELFTEDLTQGCKEPEEPKNKKRKKTNFNDSYFSHFSEESSIVNENSDDDIDCTCKLSKTTDIIDVIVCETCNRKYHAPCQGYIDKSFLGKPFYCLRCENNSDSLMSQMGAESLMSVSRLRLVLAGVIKNSNNPEEFDSHFEEALKALKTSEDFINLDGSEMSGCNKEAILKMLFNFDYKTLDF